jgi:competence protein ComEA
MSSNWVKDYFTFTKKERIGILTLITLILIVYLFPLLLPPKFTAPNAKEVAEFTALAKAFKVDSIQDDTKRSIHSSEDLRENKTVQRELFEFDPNLISENEWKRLGLKEKTIRTINNYILKGGRFRKPRDLEKIYGLAAADYRILESYVRIGGTPDHRRYKEKWNDSSGEHKIGSFQHFEKKPNISIVELNSADTADLIKLRGIGSKLARRIINFRDKLGGFISVEQVGETYGLPDSVFQSLKPCLVLGNHEIRKININTADVNTLKVHPYISWAIANALIAYRLQHGPFADVSDINKISVLNADQIQRLIPYLSTY